jgi:hypothetical protein
MERNSPGTEGSPPAWGLGVGPTTPHHKIFFIVTKWFKESKWVFVNTVMNLRVP